MEKFPPGLVPVWGPFFGVFGVLDGFSHLLFCARFLIGSGVDFGSIFDDFLMFFGGSLRFFFCFFGLGLKMENGVWTAQAWADCMCGLPEGQLGPSVFPDFFDFFPRLLPGLD